MEVMSPDVVESLKMRPPSVSTVRVEPEVVAVNKDRACQYKERTDRGAGVGEEV
jgi:hypothetical protein